MKKTLFLIFFLIGITAFAQTWTPVKNTYNTRQKYTQMVKGDSVAALAYIVGGSGPVASDTSAWTYEDTVIVASNTAIQLSVRLTRTKLIGDIVIQNDPASAVNIVCGWGTSPSLVIFPSGSLHYEFLGNPKRFYLKSESGTPSVNISYKYKP